MDFQFFLLAGAVGAAACLRVSVGAGTFEFLALVHQHLYAQTSHHQHDDNNGGDKCKDKGVHGAVRLEDYDE